MHKINLYVNVAMCSNFENWECDASWYWVDNDNRNLNWIVKPVKIHTTIFKMAVLTYRDSNDKQKAYNCNLVKRCNWHSRRVNWGKNVDQESFWNRIVTPGIGSWSAWRFLPLHIILYYIHCFCILSLAFDDDNTQTRMKMRELTLREKQQFGC